MTEKKKTMKFGDMRPGTQFIIGKSLFVKLDGAVSRGNANFMAVNINTGMPGVSPNMHGYRNFKYEVVKKPQKN